MLSLCFNQSYAQWEKECISLLKKVASREEAFECKRRGLGYNSVILGPETNPCSLLKAGDRHRQVLKSLLFLYDIFIAAVVKQLA